MDKVAYQKIRKDVSFEFSAKHFASQVLMDIALVGCISYLFFKGGGLAFLNAPLLAVLYFRSFSQMHEAVHNCLIPNRRVNNLLGILYGGFCGLPFEQWRESHVKHHFWAGNIEQDPVMAFVKHHRVLPPKLHNALKTTWFLWVPFPAFVQNALFWKLALSQPAKSTPEKLSLLAPLAIFTLAATAAFASGTATILFLSVYLYLIAIEIVNFPHHLQLPYLKDQERLPLWEQYQIARSCLYPKWFAQWIVLNFNYHSEHHMYPDAPWHSLPHIHERLSLQTDLNVDPQFDFILRTHRDGFDELLSRKEKKPLKAA